MAAFGISYKGLTRGDIRHIYSYRSPQIYIPAPRAFGRCKEFLPTPLIDKYPPRFYDYYPAFNTGLPRAPAFNKMPAESIREMVERMRRPIACQKPGPQPSAMTDSSTQGHAAKVKRKGVKAVRFRSPTRQDSYGEQGDHDDPMNQDEQKAENDSQRNDAGNSPLATKVSVRLPNLAIEKKKKTKKEKERHKKQTAVSDRQDAAGLVLPPINN